MTHLRETAYHEAGHAVIGRILALPCGEATIEIDHDSSGHSVTADPWAIISEWERRGKARGYDAAWHARIMTYMAGGEAQTALFGSTPEGDGDDRYQIELMAEELDHWAALEPRLRKMTRMLVQRHRARIERVAEALLEQTTLTAEQLDELVGRSVNDVKVNAPWLLAMARASS